MATRKIIHVDLDAFFALVEQTDNPQLKGRPVIVGGSIKRRGVVSTASYEARKFGVHSAQPIAQARKLCPQGVFLKVRFSDFTTITRSHTYEEATNLAEPIWQRAKELLDKRVNLSSRKVRLIGVAAFNLAGQKQTELFTQHKVEKLGRVIFRHRQYIRPVGARLCGWRKRDPVGSVDA